MFREFNINLSLSDVLQGIPKYLKDVVINKKKLGDIEMVTLSMECSLVVLSKMPKKHKEPKIFTLPIQIGESDVVHALSDNGKDKFDALICV